MLRLQHLLAAEREQLAHQALGALGRLVDLADVVAQRRVSRRRGELEDLRVAA